MTTLMQASNQWASRPAEQRFVSLDEMQSKLDDVRAHSRGAVVPSRHIRMIPNTEDHTGLTIAGPSGAQYAPTHAAFGQLANLVKAPAGYLRTLPAELAADALNYGLYSRDVEDVGLLLYKNGDALARAATGPRYGRIWDADIVRALRTQFGDGVTGGWRVPGEFGKAVDVTRENTTLYASDRDMFVFLADENNRIDIPGRRDGKSGSMARGAFFWNSETGDCTFGMSTFLFDYVCCNRIVWGASEVQTVKIRHTSSAPVRFIEEVAPALASFALSSQTSVTKAIEDARAHRLDNVGEWLAKRYGAKRAAQVQDAHLADEGRPIETRWDVVTGVTAYARQIPYQQERVALETDAGSLLTA